MYVIYFKYQSSKCNDEILIVTRFDWCSLLLWCAHCCPRRRSYCTYNSSQTHHCKWIWLKECILCRKFFAFVQRREFPGSDLPGKFQREFPWCFLPGKLLLLVQNSRRLYVHRKFPLKTYPGNYNGNIPAVVYGRKIPGRAFSDFVKMGDSTNDDCAVWLRLLARSQFRNTTWVALIILLLNFWICIAMHHSGLIKIKVIYELMTIHIN